MTALSPQCPDYQGMPEISSYFVVYLDRQGHPRVKDGDLNGSFRSEASAISYLNHVVIGAGAVMGVVGGTVVPVVTIDSDGNFRNHLR